ncbi:TetR/AcrR family transcriptional regulator [Desulfovirgula thermocuniculi]|uniref:TetR/AcrR family transcriptional regulator n=1 Tax=Desulfovirgula thermocuniculi TaxID=348842 RepID=UPI0003FEF975|nr:TetR/AcrR family transcriptional regulator [Desulfovirgula thermocuniculi]
MSAINLKEELLEGVNKPKTARGKATFRRLLEAAEEVFGEKGYFEASVTDIITRAGVAQGTFYLYFRTKKDIFRHLILHLHHEVRKNVQMAVAHLSDRIEAEKQGMLAFHRFILKHRNLYRLLRDLELVDEDLFKWYYKSFAERYAKRLAEAIEKGEIRPAEPEALAYCLIAINIFTGMRWPLWEGKEVPAAALNTIFDFLENGLKPPV